MRTPSYKLMNAERLKLLPWAYKINSKSQYERVMKYLKQCGIRGTKQSNKDQYPFLTNLDMKGRPTNCVFLSYRGEITVPVIEVEWRNQALHVKENISPVTTLIKKDDVIIETSKGNFTQEKTFMVNGKLYYLRHVIEVVEKELRPL